MKNITLAILVFWATTPLTSYTNDTPVWVKVSALTGAATIGVLSWKLIELQKQNTALKQKVEDAKTSAQYAHERLRILSTFCLGMVNVGLPRRMTFAENVYPPKMKPGVEKTCAAMEIFGEKMITDAFAKSKDDSNTDRNSQEVVLRSLKATTSIGITQVTNPLSMDCKEFPHVLDAGSHFMRALMQKTLADESSADNNN